MNEELMAAWNEPGMAAAIRYYERKDWVKLDVRQYVSEWSDPLQKALGLSAGNAARVAKIALAELALENADRIITIICAILNNPGEFRARYLSRFSVPIATDIASHVQGRAPLEFKGHIKSVDFISLADMWAEPFREKTSLDTNASRDVAKIALALFAYFESGDIAIKVREVANSIHKYTTPDKTKFELPWIDFDLETNAG